MIGFKMNVDWNRGWPLWQDMVRYYPAGVHRRRLVTSWLAPLRPRSVLDAGCGPGVMLEAVHEALPECPCLGVDASSDVVAENRARLPWCRFERLDLATGAWPERFDAVICSETLEHIADDERALSNLCDMAARYLVLTVPAGPIFALERGFGHLRHYEPDRLREMLQARGFRVVRLAAWGFPWMNLFKRASNLRPQAVLAGFGAGAWSPRKKAFGLALTALFYSNLPFWGPQLLVLAERRS